MALPAPAAQQAPPDFDMSTRRKILPLAALTKGAGANTQSLQLPKTGLLARVFLAIRGSVSGTLSAPNALGMASILSRVRLTVNSGIDLVNISGAGLHYLLRETLESEYVDPFGQSNARSAVTATTFNLDCVLPLAVNLQSPTGLILLQNEQTIVTLAVDFTADGSVATGATVACTVTPYIEVFTVPTDPRSYPPLSQVHQILEDQQQVAATGDYVYNWPRGNVYLSVLHGLGIGASGTDAFSAYKLRLNQSDYLQSSNVDYLDMEHRYQRGRARPPGGIYVDLLSSNGLGCFGRARDLFNSALVTDVASIITATATGTLYTVRRQLVTLA